MTDTKENTDTTYKLPNLVLTPFFENGSSWPSYYIKPIYNSDPSVENYPLYTAYYNTANNIANTIQSQSHTEYNCKIEFSNECSRSVELNAKESYLYQTSVLDVL